MANPKRKPATIWKIVESQCAQLTDVISVARIPFLLALLWAFIWTWSLYSSEFGYLKVFYRHRLDQSLLLPNNVDFKIDCDRVTSGRLRLQLNVKDKPADQWPALDDKTREGCVTALRDRRKWAEKAYLDSTAMSFPGGFPKIEESDLGVIGQCGLLLILTWLFYGLRRENHAIRTFIDFAPNTERNKRFPSKFWLEPQDDFFSAEHLVYAYHVVSQRFLFMFARYSRPLLGITMLLVSIPALVSTLHVVSDFFDVKAYDWDVQLTYRLVIEIALLFVVWFVTAGTMTHVLKSSILLNGWHLASRDVWIKEWDENKDDPASRVWVNIDDQVATDEQK